MVSNPHPPAVPCPPRLGGSAAQPKEVQAVSGLQPSSPGCPVSASTRRQRGSTERGAGGEWSPTLIPRLSRVRLDSEAARLNRKCAKSFRLLPVPYSPHRPAAEGGGVGGSGGGAAAGRERRGERGTRARTHARGVSPSVSPSLFTPHTHTNKQTNKHARTHARTHSLPFPLRSLSLPVSRCLFLSPSPSPSTHTHTHTPVSSVPPRRQAAP